MTDTMQTPKSILPTTARRIAVVGCGHVGLVMAAGFAELGNHVIGIDKSKALIHELNSDIIRIKEDGLPELVAKGLASGRLHFSRSYDDAIPTAEFIFLAVDTPQTLAGAADLRNLRAAVRSISANLNGTSPIIVNKSTSPIGTGETIESILADALVERGHAARIVSNPEFLRQGFAVYDFFHPDRTVVGSRTRADAEEVASLYATLGGTAILTDVRTAEMIKYVANAFLATRISYINEVARLCEAIGVNVDDVVDGVAEDPRIGRQFFKPGIGFGGSCLPKDVAALRYVGETLGVATPVLSAVQEVNTAMRTAAVRRLRARLGTLENRVIGVWGLTFKANTEDTRDSPAMDVVALLLNEGALVQAYDPAVVKDPLLVPERIRALLAPTPLDAARGADGLAILTEWPEFALIDLGAVREEMRGSVLFDGRNVRTQADAEAHGFAYLGVGRTATLQRRRRSDHA